MRSLPLLLLLTLTSVLSTGGFSAPQQPREEAVGILKGVEQQLNKKLGFSQEELTFSLISFRV